MTFEEGLEKLKERHEALSQTVEIIAGMQRKNEERMGEVMEAINSLARIAEAHERRISGLEGDTNGR
jgi:hypothetical protein